MKVINTIKMFGVSLICSLFLSLILNCGDVFVVSIAIQETGNEGRQEKSAENATETPVLFSSADDIRFSFDVQYFGDVKGETLINVTLDIKQLEQFNFTVDQMNKAWVEEYENGSQLFNVDGRKIELSMKESVIMYVNDKDSKNPFAINMARYEDLTLDDIKDDPKLVPMEPIEYEWTYPARCTLNNIFISVTGSSIQLRINNNMTTAYKFVKGALEQSIEGLLLAVINPVTCTTAMEFLTYTSRLGGYRDLLWGLNSIAPGRLVLIASLRDGADYLDHNVRNLVTELGSLWSSIYSYKDSWINLFIKGGKTIQDVLIPNESETKSGSPVSVHFDAKMFAVNYTNECAAWPSSSPRWEGRRWFCEQRGGFGLLCDCQSPLEFRDGGKGPQEDEKGPQKRERGPQKEEKGPQKGRKGPQEGENGPQEKGKGPHEEGKGPHERGKGHQEEGNQTLQTEIPILIMAGNRTRHFVHLLESLAVQENVTKDNILIVTDGYLEEVARIAFILDLKLLVHNPEGERGVLISTNLRFTLYNGLRIFPRADAFILLEDDLVLSPDFYSYMSQMEPIFSIDKSIYCVNAFNHLSYPHTSGDPTMTYRAMAYPSYGWMMSRTIVEEILPKWLPVNITFEWDYFMGSDLIRRNRECVIPDINRSYHWSTQGFHLGASHAAEDLYLSRNMNEVPHVKLKPVESLKKESYERDFIELLRNSLPLNFTHKADLDKKIAQHSGEGKAFAVYILVDKKNTESSFRIFAQELGTWTVDSRNNHHNTWRLLYKNETVLVIGVPDSPYWYLMPKYTLVLRGDNQTDAEVFSENVYERAFHSHPRLLNTTLLTSLHPLQEEGEERGRKGEGGGGGREENKEEKKKQRLKIANKEAPNAK